MWIDDANAIGELVGPMGAYFSMVKYTSKGIDFEVLMENEDLEFIDEWEEWIPSNGKWDE